MDAAPTPPSLERSIARTPQRIGATVRALRARRHWSQTHLAERAGISRRWLIDLEAGTAENASLGMVLRLLDTLDATVVIEAESEPR